MLNILLVNPGRHVYILNQLVRADLKIDKICIAEADLDSASCACNHSGSNIKISKASEPGFIDDLLRVSRENRISHLFPFIDYGLDRIAERKRDFEKEGVNAVISSPETINICHDKFAFSKFLDKNSIRCIPTFLDESILRSFEFPIFAKPRFGSASEGAGIIDSKEDLLYFLRKRGYVLEPYMKDREYGIDALIKGKEIYDIFMKEKLAMRAGTTDMASSLWDERIFDLVKRLIRSMDFEGPIDIDILEKDGELFVNEVNPRFGGGYASAAALGKNFFYNYLNDIKKENFADYPLGVKTSRHEKTIAVESAA